MTPNPAGLCMFVCVSVRGKERETIYITCKGKMLIIDIIERKAIHYSVGETKITHFKKKKEEEFELLMFLADSVPTLFRSGAEITF